MKIVARCMETGIDAIAVCDHNSAKNVIGVQRAAGGTSLTVLAGMEVTTSEEVHILGLFDTAEQALTLQGKVYGHLLPGENDEDLFGIQVVANELDEVEEIETRLLIGGTTIGIDAVVDAIHALGGLAVASHIDREAYSLVGQLGFIPPGLSVDGLELSASGDTKAMNQIPSVDGFPVIRCSDAHRLDEIGRITTTFNISDICIDELRKAFKEKDGRSLTIGQSVC